MQNMAGNTLQLHKRDLGILYVSMDPLIKTCNVERDITVTLTDSGICPDSEVESKIIGARYYPSSEAGNYTTRDIENHGTCTSSTTGGNEVKDVSFFWDWGKVLKEVVFLWQELRYIKSYASAAGVAVMTISIGHAHSLNIRDESIYNDLKFCWQLRFL
ncbi:hypothetical protein CISIN_1g041977mg [Citrus sinensis]|uniref:Peptidase S8/S53 domain-containing protein n=1 Tax=Citrus sinensis TaxID=2711 RepID=A0A067DGI4_CITSI|nr:hypothetical protein CISIN_1g041977mg [Citrus sinensis]